MKVNKKPESRVGLFMVGTQALYHLSYKKTSETRVVTWTFKWWMKDEG